MPTTNEIKHKQRQGSPKGKARKNTGMRSGGKETLKDNMMENLGEMLEILQNMNRKRAEHL